MEDQLASGRCILIADPEPSVRKVMTTTLRMEGYETDEAATLREALERIEENSHNLVLADLLTTNGEQPNLVNIQQLQQRCHPIPVGVVTGWRIDANAVKRAGCVFLLEKPFDLDELLQRIADYLDPPFTAEQAQQAHIIRRALQALSAGEWETLRALCTPTLCYYPLTRSVFSSARLHRL